MRRMLVLAISCILNLATTWLSAADKIKPGQEGNLEITGDTHPSVIYVPKDYKDGAKLPLILFMHGAGGKPTTWPFKTATKGEGYIIVGLSYGAFPDAGAGGIKSDPKSCDAMIDYINKVREAVKTAYGIDDKQVFLTGLSMGGWGVNFYGFNKKAAGLYRGYCIIAAGPMTTTPVDLSVAKGLPLLVLNGEKDPNLAAANKGKPAAEKAGDIVTQAIIPGQGHVPGGNTMDDPLHKWLADIAAAKAK
jgi:poly(3-hydroxybutyrate) depolymerase